MKKEKVLIIEDDKFLTKIYKTKLTNEGFEIDIVMEGSKALEKALEFKPNLILLDIILPNMSGFEVLKKLKENKETKDIPVVILSNLGQDSDIEQGKELGAEDYWVKAKYTINEVVSNIKKELEKARKNKK